MLSVLFHDINESKGENMCAAQSFHYNFSLIACCMCSQPEAF